jgi:hypothetical protein
MDGVP